MEILMIRTGRLVSDIGKVTLCVQLGLHDSFSLITVAHSAHFQRFVEESQNVEVFLACRSYPYGRMRPRNNLIMADAEWREPCAGGRSRRTQEQKIAGGQAYTERARQDVVADPETDGLLEQLLDLPQELYDWIFDLTFTPASTIVNVDFDYKPPSTLQVNRSTRAKLGPSYYSNTIFETYPTVAWRWIRTLPREYYELLREVHCLQEPPKRRPIMAVSSRPDFEHIIPLNQDPTLLT